MKTKSQKRTGGRRTGHAAVLWACGVALALGGVAVSSMPVPTTLNDFFLPGTQPGELDVPIFDAVSCSFCHGGYDTEISPFDTWSASLMAQSTRDPIFHACLTIANQDAAFAGDLCLRCHTPSGWLGGRSVPTDGSALMAGADFQGVNCHTCHRMVDPIYEAGVNPPQDEQILADLGEIPPNPHSGNYVIDPEDRRRGPRDLGNDFFYHDWAESPFHKESQMCATCHDVSNPVFERQPDGTYVATSLDEPAPNPDKYTQFPLERTFSEWAQSDFAQGPIDSGGRFGGDDPLVSSCQDCHMPTTTGVSNPFKDRPIRKDLALHHFNGGNTWVLQAVHNLYPMSETFLTQESVDASIARAHMMLRNASDLEVTMVGTDLHVRIINESGHKLPTGYVEGRRMWINVQFFDSTDTLVQEHGGYDSVTADLDVATTKVYEAKLGLDAAMAALSGRPEGEGFHFAINNMYLKDNRIPPRGFTNAGFESVQAAPVAYSYADGQHWDDTLYPIPGDAVRAEVRVFYQTTSKEYIEFLRDENVTNNTGQIAYDQWVATGKSAPAEMDFAELTLESPCIADFTDDGKVDFFDVQAFLNLFASEDSAADLNNDGVWDFFDVQVFLNLFAAGCA